MSDQEKMNKILDSNMLSNTMNILSSMIISSLSSEDTTSPTERHLGQLYRSASLAEVPAETTELRGSSPQEAALLSRSSAGHSAQSGQHALSVHVTRRRRSAVPLSERAVTQTTGSLTVAGKHAPRSPALRRPDSADGPAPNSRARRVSRIGPKQSWGFPKRVSSGRRVARRVLKRSGVSVSRGRPTRRGRRIAGARTRRPDRRRSPKLQSRHVVASLPAYRPHGSAARRRPWMSRLADAMTKLHHKMKAGRRPRGYGHKECACPERSGLKELLGFLPIAVVLGYTTTVSASAAASGTGSSGTSTTSVTVSGGNTVTSTNTNTPTLTNTDNDVITVTAQANPINTLTNTATNQDNDIITNTARQLGGPLLADWFGRTRHGSGDSRGGEERPADTVSAAASPSVWIPLTLLTEGQTAGRTQRRKSVVTSQDGRHYRGKEERKQMLWQSHHQQLQQQQQQQERQRRRRQQQTSR